MMLYFGYYYNNLNQGRNLDFNLYSKIRILNYASMSYHAY